MEKTWKPTTAGVLVIIAGIIGTIIGGKIIVGGGVPDWLVAFTCFGIFPVFSPVAAIACGVTLIIFGIIAIVCGNHARNRRSWWWALTGSILAVLIFLPLGIPAVIFLALGKNEFSQYLIKDR